MRLDILRSRMRSQRLAVPLAGPADVVRWFGAVQAQDYRGALWGVGLRTRRATAADVERAIADRAIVRTWPMRGTLHFVAPEDVRWMLRHLAPRVVRRTAGRHRELDLDAASFARSGRLLERELAGGRALTRPEIYQLLARAGISPAGQRGIHILGRLAMEGLLCFGPQRGAQPTFVLLEEWVPAAPVLEREPALAELARRYFVSHGPATAADFAWWSGSPLGEARAAIELARPHLVERAGALSGAARPGRGAAPAAQLLPAFDEYTVAYRDRSAFLDPAHATSTAGGIGSPVVLIGGRVAGTWGRRTAKTSIALTVELLGPAGSAARRALIAAAERYGRFAGMPVELDIAGARGRAAKRRPRRSSRAARSPR
jgi:Winged helix DNA-binding domain